MLFEQTLANHDFKYNFKEYTKDVAELPYSEDGNRIYYPNVEQMNFVKIPGAPIGYWVSKKIIEAMSGIKISEYGISDGQNITGDNNKYLRLLWEVNNKQSGQNMKWVPMAKGGSFRRWYGNIDTVVNWSIEARNEYKKILLREFKTNTYGIA